MAGRPKKQGLDYFPLDVDFFNDEKIEFVSARFGIKGEIIAIRLLCKIYRIGYYTEWNDDESTLLAKRAGDGITPSLVSEVVKELVKRGFFDETLLNRFGILTSAGIQRRYFAATSDRSSVDINSDFLLVDAPKNSDFLIKPGEIGISRRKISIKPADNTQSKEKKSKEKNYSSSPACADEEQQQKKLIFEIFKDRGFADPAGEVEKFFAYNEACGWKRGGSKIVDRLALAKSWQQQKRDTGGTGRKMTERLLTYEQMLDKISAADPMSNWEAVEVSGQKKPMWRRKS